MASICGLRWELRPGSQQEVRSIFEAAVLPTSAADSLAGAPRLVQLLVFAGATTAVALVEAEGDAEVLIVGLAAHQAGRRLQQQLADHIEAVAAPPDGEHTWSATAMDCILDRREGADIPGSQWWALRYPLRPGMEAAVEEVFRTSGRPRHDIVDERGAPVGQLLRTVVLLQRGLAVRVIQFTGDLRAVSRHMSSQDSVRAFEQEIEPLLAAPRDLLTPDGARRFFAESGMPLVHAVRAG